MTFRERDGCQTEPALLEVHEIPRLNREIRKIALTSSRIHLQRTITKFIDTARYAQFYTQDYQGIIKKITLQS